MSANIIRPQFNESPCNLMMVELRKVMLNERYDNVTISELIGVLEMLKYEMLQRNPPE